MGKLWKIVYIEMVLYAIFLNVKKLRIANVEIFMEID